MIAISNIERNPFPSSPIVKNFEAIVNEVLREMKEEILDIEVLVEFVNQEGSFDGEKIRLPSSLTSYPKHGHSTQYEMFLTYFKHELIHLLTYRFWRNKDGVPPAFINEGIAQYLSEYFFIKESYGFGYDELLNCFIEQGKYVPLGEFLASDRFLEFRKDARVMIENASFIGYLWREFGKENFKKLFLISKSPSYAGKVYFTPKKDFENKYKKPFEELEEAWIQNIKNLGVMDRECINFSKKFEKKDLVFKSERCPFCFRHRIDINTCPSCGDLSVVKIVLS